MEEQIETLPLARRSFLTGMGTGMTMLGTAAAMVAPASAEAQSVAESHFQPVRHSQDDWLDQIPGKHRCVFDTTTPDGANSAALYASNFFIANQSGYNLQNADLAVVIVLRHNSTPFAYNDSIWAKYGVPISQQAGNFVDPKTKAAPNINVYRTQLEGLTQRGVHFAVCQMATRVFAGAIARSNGGNTDAINDELAANLLASSHAVAAGIVALNRAQERGYTFVHAV
jgi:intracellular sulfur oxidation DsrE/DsrF family protein